MMKKIFALVLLLVLGKLSYSQYPLQQNLGSDSTIVISKGALQSRLIPIVVSDTTAANAQRMKTYPGAQLYTTNGNFYIRNANATKWVLISSGSVGPTNIYNSDGTLTGNRTLSGANNNLTFDNLNKFRVNTNDSVLYNTPNFNIKNLSGDLSVEGTVTGATSSLRLKTFEDGDWTIKTGRVGLELGDLRFYDNVNNPSSTRMIIKANGNVGVGTDSPDSLLTVAQGAYFQRGVRMSGLPTALGTKALRIDANGRLSVADTTLGGGTVTSVATNDGTGIKGGTITTSGTLYIDTTIISTVANVSGGLAGKLNISDTSNMLKDYFNSTGYGLTRSTQTILTDSATLSAYYLRRKDSLTATNPLGYVTKKVLADTAAAIRGADAGGTVTSVATNNGTGITGGTITTSGTLAIDTTIISTRAWRQKGVDSLQANINLKLNISDTASMLSPYLRSNTAAATYVPQTRTLTINGTTQDLSANRTYNVGTVTSVGLTMPAAFNVANSPVTGSGTLAVTGAGLASQYIRGDGTLANFPGGGGGGGASVSYYLNGSVNQGTFGGNTYYQMNKTPILGGGTNFTTNTNGYIAQFITNAGDPALLNIPAGNWNFELFFSASSGGGTPSYYVELYKYDGTTFTLIASGSSNPDVIINSAVDAYFSALPVPQTTLTLTDRLAVRIYVTPAGRTITLHTEDNNLCQVVTTFTTGITAINSLTAQVQYLTTGTSGTDFNISSLTDTHTFNLPVASSTNTGKLSNTDWTTFNNKVGGSLVNGYITKATGTNTIDTSQLFQSNGLIGIGTTSPTQKLQVSGNAYVNGQLFAGDTALSVYQVEGILNTPYVLGRKAVNNTLSTEARPTGVMGHVVGRGSIANRLQAANFYTTTDSASTANSTGSLRSVNAWTAHNGSGSLATAWGSYNIVQNKTTGTITNAYGSVSGVENRGATSTINKLHGTTTEIWNNYGGTIDTAFGQVISIYNNNAASNIGAVYGLSIGKGLITPTGGTHYWRNSGTIGTSYGLYLDSSIDVGTTKYALFSNSNSNSYFRAKLGIGTTSPDSAFQVATGAYFQRGIRASGLPQAAGTKALRIDASGTISYADTLIDAGGTVTSVATNNGTGITGGTITTTGTLAIDTLLISTRAWRQKGVDSLQANINQKLNISDTASMLANYITGPQTFSGYMARFNGGGTIDTSRIFQNNGLVGINTTLPFYSLDVLGTGRVTSNTYLATSSGVVGIGTTSADSLLTVEQGAWIKRGVRMSGLPSAPGTRALRINANGTLSVADTLIDAGGTVTSVATNNGTGITGGTITTTGTLAIDTLLISTRAWRQKGVDSVASLVNTRISGTTNYIPKFTSSSAIGNSIMQESGSVIDIAGSLRLSGTGYLGFGGGTNYIEGDNPNNILKFATNNSERMRLDASGNLGIGTSSPSTQLQVNGTPSTDWGNLTLFDSRSAAINQGGMIAFAGYKTSTSAQAIFAQIVGRKENATAGNEAGYLAFLTNNNTTYVERMRLDASGRVSIGGTTVTDGHLLNIQGSSAANNIGIILNKTNATAQIWGITNVGALTFYDYTNSAERMRLDASGNLLVATTSPSYNAAGRGNITIGGSSTSILSFQTGGTDRAYLYHDATNLNINNAANGALLFGTNNTERARIDASGNLGIGTSSPTEKLTVNGRISSGGITSNEFLRVNRDGSNTLGSGAFLALYNTAFTSAIFQQLNASNGLDWWTTSSKLMTLDASGNLGLGVSPSAWGLFSNVLELNGGVSIAGLGNIVYTAANAYFNSGWIYKANGTAGLQETGSTFKWYTAPSGTAGSAISFTQAMTLASTGNLLVGGTSDGGYRLNVTGTGYFSGQVNAATYLTLSEDGTYTGTYYTLGFSGKSNGANRIFGARDGSDGIYFAAATNRGFEFRPNGGTTGALSIISNGNVGIGTTSPSGLLQLNGSIATSGDAATFTIKQSSTTYTNGIYLERGGERNGYYMYIGGGLDALTFRRNYFGTQSDVMSLTRDGNVGIGTTSPAGILQIKAGNPAVYITSDDTGQSHIYFGGTTDSDAGRISYSDNADAMWFSTDNTERMRITSGGNVGIGTSSPSAWNGAAGVIVSQYSASGNSIYSIQSNSTTINQGGIFEGFSNAVTSGSKALGSIAFLRENTSTTALSSYTAFYTNNSGTVDERMRITSGGNVLVNTTSVGSLGNGIALRGDNNGAGGYGYIQISGTGTSSRGIYLYNSNGLIGSIGTTGTQLSFGSGSSDIDRMNITSGGNVLVGTTTDAGYKLDVSGTGRFTNDLTTDNRIITSNPAGGTATKWKLGAAATVSPTSPNRTIRVEIDGVTYYIAAKTTND